MREFKIGAILILTFYVVNSQFMDDNSTNFHNIMYNRKYNLSRYHTYPFDFWKNNIEKIYQRLEAMSNDTTDTDDENKKSEFDEIVEKLRNASETYLSKQCFSDLKFILRSFGEFANAAKSLIKGECNSLGTETLVTECTNNLTAVVKNNFWTVQMIDSSGHLNPGVNMGNHQHLGRYQDCKNIFVPRLDEGRPFQAAYCRATFQLPVPESAAIVSKDCDGTPLDNAVGDPRYFNRTCEPNRNFARMKWGLCAPSSCDNRNMTILFRIMLPPTKNFCNVTVVCELPKFNLKIDRRFIIVVTLVCVFGLLLICGTIYDVFFYQPSVANHLTDHKYVVVHRIDAQTIDDHKANGSTSEMVKYHNRTKSECFEAIPWYCKILLSFSVYTNGAKVLTVDDKPNELRCVHAIKALSTAWLISILAHVYIISYIDNTKVLPKFISRLCFQMINNGSFVADTFLLLSGFLLAYWFMKRNHSRHITSPLFWLKFYFRRWLRMFPPFFMTILILLFVWKYVIRGPMWTSYFFNTCSPMRCVTSFWTNFLFLNNFIHTDSPCIPITQQLAVDMQIYLFAPLFMVLYLKFPKVGFGVCGFVVLISIVFQTLSVVYNGLPPSLIATVDVLSLDLPMTRYYNKIFIKPWMRWNPFFIGMILGHLVARVSRGLIIRIGKNFTLLLWFIAIVCCTCVVYGLTGYARGYSMPTAIVAIYVAFSRLAWSLAVGAILFLCATNRGGIVEWIFSWPFWGPLSRVTYSAFLICPFVLHYTYTTSQVGIHLSTFNMVYFTCGCTLMTYMLAFVYHLTFEAPFLALRQLFCFKSMLVTNCEDNCSENNEIHSYSPPTASRANQNHPSRFEENQLLPAAIIDGVELKSMSISKL